MAAALEVGGAMHINVNDLPVVPELSGKLPARCLVQGNNGVLFECDCLRISPTRKFFLSKNLIGSNAAWLPATDFVEWLDAPSS